MTKNPVTLVRLAIKFLTYDVWRMTAENVSGTFRYFISIIKALFLSVRFFLADRMMEKASALTYYTMLSIVPLFAMILGIAKGFNVQDLLQESLAHAETGQDETITYIFRFADSYLEHAKTGVIMGLGIVMLIWVIYSLIGNIEAVFNGIWQQKKGRSTVRKVTDYLSIMIVIPILIFLVCGLQIASHTFLSSGILDETLSATLRFILRWVPYILIIIVFTLVYMVIPNAKVKFTNALVAGAVAGVGFLAFQNLYINGQIWVSKYSAIYGSFAALPLLLLWLQMSWVICLYGAELSFAAQNMKNFEFEEDTQNISRRYYDFLCAVVCGLIYNSFPERKFTTEQISLILHLPSKLTGNIVSHLRDVDVIDEAIDNKGKEEQHVWLPGKPVGEYSFGQLLEDIDTHGSTDFRYDYTELFSNEWHTITDMRAAEKNAGRDFLLRDLKVDYEKLQNLCGNSKFQKKISELLSRKD
ncbi:MAG: YihY/virulence factor BrkB family protein [Bacteroidales bacterium]|nr:YihY/virulence factor BrkB family protein [Candidatus Liminaster caballi]